LSLLDFHLRRFFEAAEFMGLKISYSKEELHQILLKGISVNNFSETRVRLSLSRAVGQMNFGDSNQVDLLILFNEIEAVFSDNPPLSVGLLEVQRSLPEIKSTSMIANVFAKRWAERNGFDEAVFVDSELIYESCFANIFALVNGVWVTPGSGVLPGVMRNLLLSEFLLETEMRNLQIAELGQIQEMFLCSSIRGIIPVVAINGNLLGDGRIGAETKVINAKLYEKLFAE
jgi:branched-subunit amino acid aminotransferase/4-amino-4-deoxychorismate lyase